MARSDHVGFGCFRMEYFAPGEIFVRHDGSLARVCEDQPYRDSRPDHIQVWIDYGTDAARKVLLNRTACAFASSSEQAALLERRIRRSGEKP